MQYIVSRVRIDRERFEQCFKWCTNDHLFNVNASEWCDHCRSSNFQLFASFVYANGSYQNSRSPSNNLLCLCCVSWSHHTHTGRPPRMPLVCQHHSTQSHTTAARASLINQMTSVNHWQATHFPFHPPFFHFYSFGWPFTLMSNWYSSSY